MPKPIKRVAPEVPQLPEYRPLSYTACRRILLEHHYSHRLPASVKLAYGVVDYGPPKRILACCVMSHPTGRWEDDAIWELSRLVRIPDYGLPLSQLIGKCLGYIRQHKLIDLIISFADAEEDHHGGIYQACSWIYDGMRGDRLDGINIDGVFVPARTCNATYGTSSPELLASRLPNRDVEPHFDHGKHCYWKALNKKGMQQALQLGLRSRSYPRPMLESGQPTNFASKRQSRKGFVNLYENKSSESTERVVNGKRITIRQR